MVEGLAVKGVLRTTGEEFLSNPALPADILKEAVPGNIRRAEHFTGFLRRFVEYLRTRMGIEQVEVQGPSSFLSHLQSVVAIEGKTLRYKNSNLVS